MGKPSSAKLERPSLAELLAGLSSGDRSPTNVVDEAIRDARACQAAVNAFAEIDEVGARDAASEAEQRYQEGRARSLEGVVIAVKDMIDTRGVPTRYGSMVYVDHVPEEDAQVVRTLKDSG